MNNVTPLVFVLSTGSDPMGAFLRFAREKEYADRQVTLSCRKRNEKARLCKQYFHSKGHQFFKIFIAFFFSWHSGTNIKATVMALSS